jgi:trans-aconitate methyltransferase
MNPERQLRTHYQQLLAEHGDGPLATQMSREGREFRFHKLLEIADLDGATVLDVGCGLGHLYPILRERYPAARYQGIDLVPEMAEAAAAKHPGISFRAIDLLTERLDERYDFVLLSSVFNNAMPDATGYLESLLGRAWPLAARGLGFNFLSTHVNFTQPTMAYHAPERVLDFCIRRLARRVRLEHHYERCDVAVFVYR